MGCIECLNLHVHMTLYNVRKHGMGTPLNIFICGIHMKEMSFTSAVLDDTYIVYTQWNSHFNLGGFTYSFSKSTEVLNLQRGFITPTLKSYTYTYIHVHRLHTCVHIMYTRMFSRATERYTENCTCDKMADLINHDKQITL